MRGQWICDTAGICSNRCCLFSRTALAQIISIEWRIDDIPVKKNYSKSGKKRLVGLD